MARTKGDGGAARSVGAKAPRKALGGGSSGAASRAISAAASPRGGGGGGGGASYNPLGQPVPGWQKPMTSFFTRNPNTPPLRGRKILGILTKTTKKILTMIKRMNPQRKKRKKNQKMML